MMQPREVSAELETFIRKKRCLSTKHALNPNDRMESDLGLTGDDAAYFMEAFFDSFHVEVGDFNFDQYFVNEFAPGPFLFLASLVFKKVRRKYEREPLTVAMLQHAIDLGVWDSQRLMEWENQHPKE